MDPRMYEGRTPQEEYDMSPPLGDAEDIRPDEFPEERWSKDEVEVAEDHGAAPRLAALLILAVLMALLGACVWVLWQ